MLFRSIAVSLAFDARGELSGPPVVSGVGVVDDGEEGDGLMKDVEEAIASLPKAKRKDDEAVMLAVKRAARVYYDDIWGKRPVIVTHIHRARS